jgi:DNA polymerase-1
VAELQQHEGPLNVFKHIEMPLVPVLSRVERNGVKIDPAVLHAHSQEIAKRLIELEQKAHEIAGKRLTSLHRNSCKPSCLKNRVSSR